MLSHELRTPLNAMVSWLGALKRQIDAPEQVAHAVASLERSVWQQARLVRDLLDVSRIVAGKLDLEIEPVDVGEIVRLSVDEQRPAAERKGIVLTSNEVGGPSRVQGDPARLGQAVRNLLDNAVKFTPKDGRIDVTIERLRQEVRITVRDTGEGIAAEFLPHVFDRFRQFDNSTTRHHGGLGLGLAIAKHLAERHGGNIEAASPGRDQGATFVLSLPLAGEPGVLESPLPPGPDRPQASLDVSVLLVDDDADTCEGMAVVLRQSGALVRIARSVSEALEIDGTQRLDVLVSDISMPGSDGYTLIGKIRERDLERGTRTFAIAMTGMAGLDDRERALAAGFDAHLAKPIEPTVLITTLRKLMGAG